MKLNDLTGLKFGKLQVLEREQSNNKKVKWRCICDCGNYTTVESHLIKKGHTKSCGCLRKEKFIEMTTTHGKSNKIPEYIAWKGMIARCTNSNENGYKNYGGRGITICKSWGSSFESFLADMGYRPSPNHSIDRIDVNGNYEPNNCRWATRFEQSINKRIHTNNTSGTKGVSLDRRYNLWKSEISVDSKRIFLGYFKNIEDAIDERKKAEYKYWEKSS